MGQKGGKKINDNKIRERETKRRNQLTQQGRLSKEQREQVVVHLSQP